jgi:hypothetical protein
MEEAADGGVEWDSWETGIGRWRRGGGSGGCRVGSSAVNRDEGVGPGSETWARRPAPVSGLLFSEGGPGMD